MRPSTTSGHRHLPSQDDLEGLRVLASQCLSLRVGGVSAEEERRLVQVLARLQPALQEAITAGLFCSEAFESCLTECSDD